MCLMAIRLHGLHFPALQGQNLFVSLMGVLHPDAASQTY